MASEASVGGEFQSHAGSIEALADLAPVIQQVSSFNPTLVRLRPTVGSPPDGSPPAGFNPTLVRLRRRMRDSQAVTDTIVSIPRWFD